MDDMTPTERLRALLDERSIAWVQLGESSTEYTMNGVLYRAYETYGGLQVAIITPVTPEQAIAATVGNTMTLDEATEYVERFMGDYAKVLLDESTLYVERDEPTDQHAFNVAERKEAQMARDLAEALATAGGYAITFAPTLDRPPETMVGETVFDADGNAIGWIANARIKEVTE